MLDLSVINFYFCEFFFFFIAILHRMVKMTTTKKNTPHCKFCAFAKVEFSAVDVDIGYLVLLRTKVNNNDIKSP